MKTEPGSPDGAPQRGAFDDEQLLGFVLEALDAAEQESVARAVADDPRLQARCQRLRSLLQPFSARPGRWAGVEDYDPPVGLAQRTCEYVRAHGALLPSRGGWHAISDWRPIDLFVAAGVLVAACLLLFPAIAQSRFHAQVAGCQQQLRELGVALWQYSDRHDGMFPVIPAEGPLAFSGVYSSALLDGYLQDESLLHCPASSAAPVFDRPTMTELQAAAPEDISAWRPNLGGSYGYTLGYLQEDRYHGIRNQARPFFAIMADVSAGSALNHGRRGQNVLFEDLHVQFLRPENFSELGEDIFRNDQGEVAAGQHAQDACIGQSVASPLPRGLRDLMTPSSPSRAPRNRAPN